MDSRFWLRRGTRTACAALAAATLAWSGTALAQDAAKPKVRLATSAGDIVLELDRAKAPKTVDNFVQYVSAGHYDGTVFHRVIPDFMIQGGGMSADLKEKPTRAPIALETRGGLPNERGTVAMARTADPDSATAQFFINLKRNAFLDGGGDGRSGYAVFGRVVSGMETVDRIAQVATGGRGMHQNVPLQPVTLNKATLEK
jgi:peptidyl-prolyl cis-trans isomerase A (cyclophilin A)